MSKNPGINSVVEKMQTENAFAVAAQAQELINSGKDIIRFEIGDLNFNTSNKISDVCYQAIFEGITKYCSSAGIPQLRRAVAKHVSKTRKINIDMENVVIAPGAKPIIIFGIMSCLLSRGDEVVMANPVYPAYPSLSDYLGFKPVFVPLKEENNFVFKLEDLEKKVNDKTRIIILNSPQNPTGGILSRDDLEGIADIANHYNLWVISDEVYSNIIYKGNHESIASIKGMQEKTLVVDGFSKTYSMTGWRLGYGVAPKNLIQAMVKLVTNYVSCTPPFIQFSGCAALSGSQDETKRMVKELKIRRNLMVDGLNKIEGISCKMPNGAFYAFPNVTKACENLGLKDSREMREYLMHCGVSTLDRMCFGEKNEGEDQEYLRLCYASQSIKNIEIGLERIEGAIVNSNHLKEFNERLNK